MTAVLTGHLGTPPQLRDFDESVYDPERFGRIKVLDGSGDTRTMWDRDNASDVEIARKQFDDMKAKGMLAYRISKKGNAKEVLTDFDPAAEALIYSRPLAGG